MTPATPRTRPRRRRMCGGPAASRRGRRARAATREPGTAGGGARDVDGARPFDGGPGTEEVVRQEPDEVVDVVVVNREAAVAGFAHRSCDVFEWTGIGRPTTSTRGVITSLTVVSRRSARALTIGAPVRRRPRRRRSERIRSRIASRLPAHPAGRVLAPNRFWVAALRDHRAPSRRF